MSELNLQADDPLLLVDRATPAELAAAIRRLGQWDTRALETANRLISVWAARAIARPNDREGIAELQRLIHHVLKGSSAPAGLLDEYVHRWQTTNDLLEARRLNLAHANPTGQLSRRHVPEILGFLAQAENPEVPQAALAEHLNLSPGRITQIVGPLETHGLITKRRSGRDNTLRLTQQGRELAPQPQPKNLPASASRAGDYLTLRKAA